MTNDPKNPPQTFVASDDYMGLFLKVMKGLLVFGVNPYVADFEIRIATRSIGVVGICFVAAAFWFDRLPLLQTVGISIGVDFILFGALPIFVDSMTRVPKITRVITLAIAAECLYMAAHSTHVKKDLGSDAGSALILLLLLEFGVRRWEDKLTKGVEKDAEDILRSVGIHPT